MNEFWKVPHGLHRQGTSVDINKRRFNVASEGTEVTPKIGIENTDPLRMMLKLACSRGGARLYPKENRTCAKALKFLPQLAKTCCARIRRKRMPNSMFSPTGLRSNISQSQSSGFLGAYRSMSISP